MTNRVKSMFADYFSFVLAPCAECRLYISLTWMIFNKPLSLQLDCTSVGTVSTGIGLSYCAYRSRSDNSLIDMTHIADIYYTEV